VGERQPPLYARDRANLSNNMLVTHNFFVIPAKAGTHDKHQPRDAEIDRCTRKIPNRQVVRFLLSWVSASAGMTDINKNNKLLEN
jgi:hypothetical protein